MITKSFQTRDDTLESYSFNWSNRQILIIEDDYVNFLYLRDVLTPSHAEIKRIFSLNEVLEQFISEYNFDLIILNTTISGNEDCRAISRVKAINPNIPVLAFADHECKIRSQKCMHTGCDIFISLRMDDDELLLTIDELLKPKSS
jgi:DNA-binding NarL/FixJ family response regulator